jgi:hypothetical protein
LNCDSYLSRQTVTLATAAFLCLHSGDHAGWFSLQSVHRCLLLSLCSGWSELLWSCSPQNPYVVIRHCLVDPLSKHFEPCFQRSVDLETIVEIILHGRVLLEDVVCSRWFVDRLRSPGRWVCTRPVVVNGVLLVCILHHHSMFRMKKEFAGDRRSSERYVLRYVLIEYQVVRL